MDLVSIIAPLLASIGTKYIEKFGERAGKIKFQEVNSFLQRTKRELEEDSRTQSVLNQLELSNDEELSNQSLEIIAETLEEKIKTNPDFAREAQEVKNIYI